MKRAFLVLGPESSGTRWITSLLIRAGCAGSAEHVQPWDSTPPTDEPLIVWRRSFPHGDIWPDVGGLVWLLNHQGYDVQALVMVRDWFAMRQSQFQFRNMADVAWNMAQAYLEIFTGLAQTRTPYLVVSYEALVQRPVAFGQALLHELGLYGSVPADFETIDGNAKWYEAVAD